MTSIEDCCKFFIRKTKMNLRTSTLTHGTIMCFCHDNKCLKPLCIKDRIRRKHYLYQDAFSPVDVAYYIKLKCGIVDAFNELKGLFKKVIVFDCFDYSEAYFSNPINSKVDLSLFEKVNFYRKIKDTISNHVVNIKGIEVEKNMSRVRYKNIHVNKRAMRIATIDGVYAVDSGITKFEANGRIKHLLSDEVSFEFYEENVTPQNIILLSYKEILNSALKDKYLEQLKRVYGFTEAHFRKFE